MDILTNLSPRQVFKHFEELDITMLARAIERLQGRKLPAERRDLEFVEVNASRQGVWARCGAAGLGSWKHKGILGSKLAGLRRYGGIGYD